MVEPLYRAKNVAITDQDGDPLDITNGGIPTFLKDENGTNLGVHYPLEVDGDSVYIKDVDESNSTAEGWDPIAEGTVSDLFGEREKGLTHTGSTNPKTIVINFFRPIVTTGGLGLTTTVGNFSNVKVTALQLDANNTEVVLIDLSSVNTKLTILPVNFAPTGFNALKIEFHTADAVSITGMFIPKAFTTLSRIQGQDEVTDLIEDIKTRRGALNINKAWVHRKIVNETFHQHTGTTTTPSVAITAGDTSITVADPTGIIVGSEIKLTEGLTQEIGLITITVVVGSVLTLDRPLGNDYTTSADISEVISDMAVLGSLASPQIFEMNPPIGTIWQVTRIMFEIFSAVAPDDGKFGGIAALTNGASLRATTEAGRTVVFANWKNNGDMKLDMFDVDFTDKGPGGTHGVNGRWTFTNAEVVAELNGDASPIQKIEILIQDDLRTLTLFKQKGQGRVFSP